MKKNVIQQTHFLDQLGEIIFPAELAEKWDSYGSIRKESGKETYTNL